MSDHLCNTENKVSLYDYDQKATAYTNYAKVVDFFGLAWLRRRLLGSATGRVLEVAAGSGQNLKYYPPGVNLTLTDLSQPMLVLANRQANKRGLVVTTGIMNTENLDFPDDSFDTVVSSLSICSYDDPIRALREMARVCQPAGQILLLEHGESSWRIIAAWQRWRQSWEKKPSCQLTRNPLILCQQAGLKVESCRRSLFGIIFAITAAKS